MTTPPALEAFARAKGGTVFHPAGTCRMGGDARSVVDERLRVRGVDAAARHRRLGDAARRLDQHQRRGDHDRREGRGARARGCRRRRTTGARAGEAARGMILDNAQAPLYVQLADLFRQRIVKGVWKEGEKLPSLEQLVAEFEVARVTVRQAIERLTRDGLVSPQRGRGTFVTGAPQQRPLAARRDVAAEAWPTSTATPTRRSSTSTSRRAARASTRATASRRRGTSTCAASTRTRAGRTASSTSTSTPRSSRAIRRAFARRR